MAIPDSVTTIGAGAFYNDYNLTELFIPDSWADDGVTLSNNMFNYSCFSRYCYNPNPNAVGPKIVCQGETNNCYKALAKFFKADDLNRPIGVTCNCSGNCIDSNIIVEASSASQCTGNYTWDENSTPKCRLFVERKFMCQILSERLCRLQK